MQDILSASYHKIIIGSSFLHSVSLRSKPPNIIRRVSIVYTQSCLVGGSLAKPRLSAHSGVVSPDNVEGALAWRNSLHVLSSALDGLCIDDAGMIHYVPMIGIHARMGVQTSGCSLNTARIYRWAYW